MNTTDSVVLAINAFAAIMKLLIQLKAQNGLTNEQILELAGQQSAETRQHLELFIAQLKQE